MATTAAWSPNQALVAQVEQYTFTAPSGVGNTYTATLNGKTITYASILADTAALAATGLYNLLNRSSSVPAEFTEITFANPSAGVVTATAKSPGTPFANISGSSGGLVLSTGNGLVNGIATAHTTANASPSDVNDAQNWLRTTAPAPGVRQVPQNGDDVVVANTAIPMLWNLGALAAVQFGTYTRWQSFTGTIGLPENNPGGYGEWRETYFKFAGPAGSVPAGGLQMVLGFSSGSGQGPTRERYNVGSSPATLTVLAAGSAADEYGIRFLGVHTANAINLLGGASVGVAMLPGEVAGLSTSSVGASGRLGIGQAVTWTAGSALTLYGASAVLNAAPATLQADSGSSVTVARDALTWAAVNLQGGSSATFLAGGTITTLTMTTSSRLDKSGDMRGLIITNSTLDGDTCTISDPNNAITFTNATTVKQQVSSGPLQFTGTRTVKLT